MTHKRGRRDIVGEWEEEVETLIDHSVSVVVPLNETIRLHSSLFMLQNRLSIFGEDIYERLENWAYVRLFRHFRLLAECRLAMTGCLLRLEPRLPCEVRTLIMVYYVRKGVHQENMEQTTRYLTFLLSALRSGDIENKKIRL